MAEHATCTGHKCACDLFYDGEGCCSKWDQYSGWSGNTAFIFTSASLKCYICHCEVTSTESRKLYRMRVEDSVAFEFISLTFQ
jgi:hypothetical protein